jgi:hypothetical protein
MRQNESPYIDDNSLSQIGTATSHNYDVRRDIRTLLFWNSQKDQAQIILLTKAVQTCIKNNGRFTEVT